MEEICGEEIQIHYDKKVKKLNLEFAKDNIGSPVILLQDWTVKGTSKHLLTLHIKEAIQLKAVIDSIVVDYFEHQLDKVSESGDALTKP